MTDETPRRTWQQQSRPAMAAAPGAMVMRRLAERRRMTIRFWASAAIIVPSWIAGMVWLPDLRPLAAIGLTVSALLMWQFFRPVAGPKPGMSEPCAHYERRLLEDERRFHDALPKRIMAPILVIQFAIVATLLTNPRFEKNLFFTGSLSFFILTVITVLTMVYRRARRTVSDIDRELAVLQQGLQS